jgi:hypothetical protein
MPETIDLLLKELKLPTFSRHYQRHQAQAIDKGYGHIRYLSGLCEQEVADRYQKRVQKWTREAGLPPGKSFANLILPELSASVQQQVIGLKDQTDWAHDAGNVFKGVAIFAKDFSGLPARKISKKLRDRQCLRLPRSVLVTSFRPNKGSKHRFQMT